MREPHGSTNFNTISFLTDTDSEELMRWWAGWIYCSRRPSSSTTQDTHYTRCGRLAGDRGGSASQCGFKFLCYEATMLVNCLRLMGRKLLVALAIEGKFAGEGLQTLDNAYSWEDDQSS